ncbi:MAG: MiaB/RimO family radical SAM methylthiotransferase [Patescibacteria group bacterium]|nr:MiaB/RimO family radical SAM methylthiotransferase [Patescibacteria group bacterium]
MKYFIKIYGCQMNYSDSERIAAVLETAGYQKTLSEDNADLIIINACSVRQSALNRISGRFKKYKKLRKINPNLKIILTGCVLESDKKKFEKMFDLVVRIEEIEQMIKSPLPPFDKGGDIIIPPLKERAREISYFRIKPLRQSKISAYVPIMTGCDNFCSYCVVPYTRGREYSRPAEEILSEIEDLVKQGYKEIILLGQNVNSYKGKVENQKCILSFLRRQESTATSDNSIYTNPYKISNPTKWIPACAGMTGNTGMTGNAKMAEINNFPKLLKLLNAIPGDFWIRFLTSHPKDMSEKLIKIIAECEKVTPYIHLALQSGDDEILKKMNRKYTSRHFLELVKMIRKYLPDAAISTDIIIGFPGETEKQFLNTVEIMKKAGFDMAYLNKYSPRPGTAAAKLNDSVSWQEKKRREKILTEILEETALENNEKYVGKIVKVLVSESRIKNQESRIISGKTRSFKNVKIHDSQFATHNSDIVGKFLNIKITQAGAWGLEGEMVK